MGIGNQCYGCAALFLFVFTHGGNWMIDVVQLFGYYNQLTGGIGKLCVDLFVDELCGLLQLGDGEGVVWNFKINRYPKMTTGFCNIEKDRGILLCIQNICTDIFDGLDGFRIWRKEKDFLDSTPKNLYRLW